MKWLVEDPAKMTHVIEFDDKNVWYGTEGLAHTFDEKIRGTVRQALMRALLKYPEAGTWGEFSWLQQ